MNKINSLLKFTECFGLDPKFINAEKSAESYYIEKGIDVEAFKTLMIKNDLGEYTIILLCYITEVYFSAKVKEYVQKHTVKTKEAEKKRNHEIELTQSLQFLLSKNDGECTSLTFHKSRKSHTMSNQLILKSIVDNLILEFKSNDYDKVELTYDEAKVMMATNDEWAKGLFCEVNLGSVNEPNIVEVEFTEAIEDFASSTTKEVEIDVDFLSKKLEILTKNSTKKGAKITNYRIASLCNDLSFLKRIDRYLLNDEIEYLENVKLINNDCRFIHDCLVFFKIIEDKSKTLTKSLPENYIRALLKQKKQDEFDDDINRAKNKRINDLRNSKVF